MRPTTVDDRLRIVLIVIMRQHLYRNDTEDLVKATRCHSHLPVRAVRLRPRRPLPDSNETRGLLLTTFAVNPHTRDLSICLACSEH